MSLTGEPTLQSRWHGLADRVLSGEAISRDDAAAILQSPDAELLDLLAAAYRVRREHFGDRCICIISRTPRAGCARRTAGTARSRSSRSRRSRVIAGERGDALMEGARQAEGVEAPAPTASSPADGAHRIAKSSTWQCSSRRSRTNSACTSVPAWGCSSRSRPNAGSCGGRPDQSQPEHQSRVTTRRSARRTPTKTGWRRCSVVRKAGMELCSGLIVGMGETADDMVDVTMELRDLKVHSIPVNFLHSIDGTPLAKTELTRPAVLPEGALPAATGASNDRDPHRRRARGQPPLAAGDGPLRRELDVRQRLPDHQGPGRGRQTSRWSETSASSWWSWVRKGSMSR